MVFTLLRVSFVLSNYSPCFSSLVGIVLILSSPHFGRFFSLTSIQFFVCVGLCFVFRRSSIIFGECRSIKTISWQFLIAILKFDSFMQSLKFWEISMTQALKKFLSMIAKMNITKSSPAIIIKK